MKILPTLEGGLRIDIEEDEDWEIFEILLIDARGRSPDWLAKRLGVLMEEEDGEEYVVPELTSHFSSQAEVVKGALTRARQKAKNGKGELFIERSDGEIWYGLVNRHGWHSRGNGKFPL